MNKEIETDEIIKLAELRYEAHGWYRANFTEERGRDEELVKYIRDRLMEGWGLAEDNVLDNLGITYSRERREEVLRMAGLREDAPILSCKSLSVQDMSYTREVFE